MGVLQLLADDAMRSAIRTRLGSDVRTVRQQLVVAVRDASTPPRPVGQQTHQLSLTASVDVLGDGTATYEGVASLNLLRDGRWVDSADPPLAQEVIRGVMSLTELEPRRSLQIAGMA